MSRAGDVEVHPTPPLRGKTSAPSGVAGGWRALKETSKGISSDGYGFVEPLTLFGLCAIIYCSCSHRLANTSPW